MKKMIVLGAMFGMSLCTYAQNSAKDFEFTTIKEIPITSIKNQNRSGTCWAYSSLGFFA